MKILPVFSHLAPDSWNASNLPHYWTRLAARSGGRHVPVADAAEADVYLFLGNDEPFRDGLHSVVRAHPLVRAAPHRCFAWDFNDRPIGVLPGLYASLPCQRSSPRWEAYCYLMQPNPRIEDVYHEQRQPDLLFSFAGAFNARVRHALPSLREVPGARILNTTDQPQWFGTSGVDEYSAGYAELLARSQFVLCPRGIGTSSYRIFETMQMGRVPVILSDNWVTPSGISWESFSVRVPERSVGQLPELLRECEPRSATMGSLARRIWEQHFAPAVQLDRVGDAIERIGQRTPPQDLGISRWWPLQSLEYRREFWTAQAVAAAATAKRAVLSRLQRAAPGSA